MNKIIGVPSFFVVLRLILLFCIICNGIACGKDVSKNKTIVNQTSDIQEISTYNAKGKLIAYRKYKGTELIQEKKYLESGQLTSDIYYGEDGKKGYYKTYNYESGRIASEVPVVNRLWEGERKTYNYDGSVRKIVIYRDGVAEGGYKLSKGREYYASGKIKSETQFGENGTGYDKTYYESGQIKTEVPIVDKQWHGQEKFYKTDGTLEGTLEYIHGMPKGYKPPNSNSGSRGCLSIC